MSREVCRAWNVGASMRGRIFISCVLRVGFGGVLVRCGSRK